MDKKYRIVFKGAIVEGFDLATVKQAAAKRLKLEGGAIEKVFCGRRAVLKRNLDHATAERYLGALLQIGMQAAIEEQPALVASASPEIRSNTFDALATELVAPPAPEPVVEFDPHKTHINLARAEELLNRVAATTMDDILPLPVASRLADEYNKPIQLASVPMMTGTQQALMPTPVLVQLVSEPVEKVEEAEPWAAVVAPAAVRASSKNACSEPCCPRCGEDLSVLLELYMQDAALTTPRTRVSNRGAERGWLHSVWGWFRPRAA